MYKILRLIVSIFPFIVLFIGLRIIRKFILAVCLMMSYILLLINKVGISDVIVYSVLYAVIEGGIYYVCMYYRSEEETQ